jgi:4,5-DOPA dioxygenase extradiol
MRVCYKYQFILAQLCLAKFAISRNLKIAEAAIMATQRQPVFFLSHGGPGTLLNGHDKNVINFWSNEFGPMLRKRSPKAIIFLSAHWFAHKPTINTSSTIIHDFGEFFPGIYDIGYDTVQVSDELLNPVKQAIGSSCAVEDRGLDHGTWIPMKFMDPKGQIPIIQIGLPPKASQLIDLGRKLKPLRDQGYMIMASGGTVHNLQHAFANMNKPNPDTPKWAIEFESDLNVTLSHGKASTAESFAEDIEQNPQYSKAHPTPDHFFPMLVAVASADKIKAKRIYEEWLYGSLAMSVFQFYNFGDVEDV